MILLFKRKSYIYDDESIADLIIMRILRNPTSPQRVMFDVENIVSWMAFPVIEIIIDIYVFFLF